VGDAVGDAVAHTVGQAVGPAVLSATASSLWRSRWFETEVKSASALLWRGVEAQHIVATMRLVDSLAEQEQLERLLEISKPPLPAAVPAPTATAANGPRLSTPRPRAAEPHYLLSTPFRYRSPHASRFRIAGDPGLWYGAKERDTACTEIAYWRWRFLMDSAGLRTGELITEHTLFQAQAKGKSIDLTRAPWSAAANAWAHPTDYTACQALATAARSHGVQWIRYASARRSGGSCAAVLSVGCLSLPKPMRMETWVCKVTATQSLMLHDGDRLTVAFAT
jgi:hypothetical protein